MRPGNEKLQDNIRFYDKKLNAFVKSLFLYKNRFISIISKNVILNLLRYCGYFYHRYRKTGLWTKQAGTAYISVVAAGRIGGWAEPAAGRLTRTGPGTQPRWSRTAGCGVVRSRAGGL